MNIGDKIRDNDPRMGNRVLTITGIMAYPFRTVLAVDSMGREREYLGKYIHADGKPRRSGFTLLAALGSMSAVLEEMR